MSTHQHHHHHHHNNNNNNNHQEDDQPTEQKTRLIVKSLPPHIDNNRLKKTFEPFGEITDCKVMHTKDGKSRCFAFVGFKTHKMAQKAIRSLDQTFVDMSRINVSFALPMKHGELSRPWSKYSDGSSLHDKRQQQQQQQNSNNKNANNKKGGGANASNKQVNDFLGIENNEQQANKKNNNNKKAFWANDDDDEENATSTTTNNNKNNNNNEDDHDDNQQQTSELSDMDYFKSKIDDSVTALTSSSSTTTTMTEKVEIDEGRVFFWNLDYSTTEDELYDACHKFGEISQVHIPIDNTTKKSKGYGYVLFLIPENAEQAIAQLNNNIFQGRLIYAKMANKPKTLTSSGTGRNSNFFFADDDNLSFKQKQMRAKRIQDAMNPEGHHENWNSMFMRADTVAESISRQVGLTKRQLLMEEGSSGNNKNKDKSDGDEYGMGADNAAVRLALGETELIKQTKEQLNELSDLNVDLSQLRNGQAKRSKKIILVKNLSLEQILSNKKELLSLSFDKQRQKIEGELQELFASTGGQVARTVLLQSGTFALIEFYEPTEARKAFRSLAYKKFHHVPLYLEWAPLAQKSKKDESATTAANNASETKNTEADEELKQSGTLFVKNLNFKTTEKSLEKLFKGHNVRNVTIARKPVKKSDNRHEDSDNKLGESRGFGFIEFASLDNAVKAKEALNGTQLDGHKLQLEYSSLRAENVQPATDDALNYTDDAGRQVTFKKLIVRNVAFEATQRDIYQLFSAFGEIKDVRLPRKVSSKSQHRGFAFVEFASRKECHNAYDALKHTHLYGRSLVLEFAADDTEASLDAVKEKTRKRFADNNNPLASNTRDQKKRRLR